MKRQLLALTIIAGLAGADFDMVVLGDRTGGAQEDTFETILEEVKVLKPNLLMNVGDLIEGYTKSRDTLEQEWDTIVKLLRGTGVDYHLTPGNHDVWDALSESVYVRRAGSGDTIRNSGTNSGHVPRRRLCYSFDLGNCHFLVVDNSRWDSTGSMPADELAWLERDLMGAKSPRWRFVFMHRSYWNQALRQSRPEKLHDMFRRYGVDYVFSGHDHYYCSTLWDGIHYIQVGPSGSRYKQYDDPDRGAFQSYLLVHVSDSATKVTVVKPGNRSGSGDTIRNSGTNSGHVPRRLSEDCVTLKDIALLDSIDQRAVELSRIRIEPGARVEDSIMARITNLTGSVLSSRCAWSGPESLWRIEPETLVVVCNPGVTVTNQFTVQLPADANPYPLLSLNLPYPYGKARSGDTIPNQKTDSGHVPVHAVDRLLPIQRVASCPRVTSAPALDGRLNDKCWKKVRPLKWYGSSEGKAQPTEPFDVYLAHNDTMLFIAARCTESKMDELVCQETQRDGRVANDDNVNFLFQPDTGGTTYYQLIVNPLGAIWDRKCDKEGGRSVRDNKWNGNWQIASGKGSDFWTLEIAVPLRGWGPDSGPRSKVWGFNLVRFQARTKAVAVFQVPFAHDTKQFAVLRME
jgi:hypothetical protein